jgi:glutathione S-transferase
MARLIHFRLCPRSRSVRLALAELAIPAELVEERPWEWRPELLALNPAGELPVLELDDGTRLAGAYPILEYLAETVGPPADSRQMRLIPGSPAARAEVRRLVDWFHAKLDREVTRELLTEKVYARMRPSGERPPDADVLRAIRANLRYHLTYIGHLAHARRWLAGPEASFADLAAAAHLSVIDYLGEMPWDDFVDAKAWYERVKSRRSFRPLLADRLPGLAPPAHYAELDF